MIWWQISSEPKGRRVKQKSSNLTEREQMCTIRPLVVKYNWSLTFGEMGPCYRGMLRGTITPRAQRDGSLFKTGRDWELASVYDTLEGFGVIRRGDILVFFLCSTVFCPCHSFQLNDQIFGHSSTAARIFEPLKIPIALTQTRVMSVGSLIAGFECLLECKPYCWQCELPHQCKA